MKPGYYSIKNHGNVLPARWDGKMWHHERGKNHECEVICDENGDPIPISLGCPTGCTCTVNSDGSVTTHCT
jgi:hypothetical protein